MAKQAHETWIGELMFDMSDEQNGTNIVNLLQFVSSSDESIHKEAPPFPSLYDTSQNGIATLRHDLKKAAKESGYEICVTKSHLKHAKKKITFGCQWKSGGS